MLDRRRFLSRASMIAGLSAAGLSVLGAPAFGQTGKKWVCPPCGCGEDHVAHDAPGRCPGCGMPLVEKAQPAPPPATSQQTSSPQPPAKTEPPAAKPAVTPQTPAKSPE